MKWDEKLLVSALKQGDEKALKVLFDTFYPSLCLFAGHYLKNESESADIVQESFLKYWDRHENFDAYSSIKSFLYVVVQHACLSCLHKKHPHVSLGEANQEDALLVFGNLLVEEEAHRLLNSAIDDLPVQQRNVILYALEGLSTIEIAEKMNLAKSSVVTYKRDAYKRLKNSMKECYYILMIFLLADGDI